MKPAGPKKVDWIAVGAVLIPCYLLLQLVLWSGFILPRWTASAASPLVDILISFFAGFSLISLFPAIYYLLNILLALRQRRGEYFLRLGKIALSRGDKETAKRLFSQSRRWGTNWAVPWESGQAVVELAKEQLNAGCIDDAVKTIKSNECAPYWLNQFAKQKLQEDQFDEALHITNSLSEDVCFHAEIVGRIALRMARQGNEQASRQIFFDLIRRATIFRKTIKEPFVYQRRHFPRIIQGMILAGFLDDAESAVSNWPYRQLREDADVPYGAVAISIAVAGQEDRAVEIEGRIVDVIIRANTAKRMGVGQSQQGLFDAALRSFQRGIRWSESIDDPYEKVKSYRAIAFAWNKYLPDNTKPVEEVLLLTRDNAAKIDGKKKKHIATKMLAKLERYLHVESDDKNG